MLKLAWIEAKCYRKGNRRADQHARACFDRARVQSERNITERINTLKLAWIEPGCNRKRNHRADRDAQACLGRPNAQSEGKSPSRSACSSLPRSSRSAIGRGITERISMLKLALIKPNRNRSRTSAIGRANHRADQHAQACLDQTKPQSEGKSPSGSIC